MFRAHAGSGLVLLALPVVWGIAVVRIRMILSVSASLAASRGAFFVIGIGLGVLSGLAVGTALGEKSMNLALLAVVLASSTAIACFAAPDET